MGALENTPEEQAPLEPESSTAGKKLPPQVEPLPVDPAHNAKNLGSWARRTGYKSANCEDMTHRSDIQIDKPPPANSVARAVPPAASAARPPRSVDPSAKTNPTVASVPSPVPNPAPAPVHVPVLASRDLESGGAIPPANGVSEVEKTKILQHQHPHPHPHPHIVHQQQHPFPPVAPGPYVPGRRGGHESMNVSGVQSSAGGSGPLRIEPLRMYNKNSEMDDMSQSQDGDDYLLSKHSHMKYEIREHPGLGELSYETSMLMYIP